MFRDPGLVPLSRDHHRALTLCVLADRALASDRSAENCVSQAARIVEQFDSEIHEHFEFEEQVLFPALAEMAGFADLISELTAEHRRMEAFIASLRSGGDWPAIQEFCEILRRHVRKEEQVLFEDTQRVLSREQLDEIGQKRQPPACRR